MLCREVWLEMGWGHSEGIQRLIQLHQEWELEYKSTYRDFAERYSLIHCCQHFLRDMCHSIFGEMSHHLHSVPGNAQCT